MLLPLPLALETGVSWLRICICKDRCSASSCHIGPISSLPWPIRNVCLIGIAFLLLCFLSVPISPRALGACAKIRDFPVVYGKSWIQAREAPQTPFGLSSTYVRKDIHELTAVEALYRSTVQILTDMMPTVCRQGDTRPIGPDSPLKKWLTSLELLCCRAVVYLFLQHPGKKQVLRTCFFRFVKNTCTCLCQPWAQHMINA